MRKANTRQIQNIKKKILPILKKYKIKRAGIFGSYARGEQKRNSDIDIIIQPPKGMGFGFAGIQMELEKKLGKKVDMVTYKYLSPYLRDRILESEVRAI
ncbi:MAG: nucleotidyltransferase family protein [Nanoarchaeota archaeon]|nr:nucleotidyltransferase family protein [Nanoarchaeota archaeon]